MFCQTGFFVIFTQTLDFPVGKRLCKFYLFCTIKMNTWKSWIKFQCQRTCLATCYSLQILKIYFSLVFLFFIKHFVLIFLILQELQGDFFICFIYKFNSFVYLSRYVFYISVYSPLFSVNLYLISYICYILHIYFSSFLYFLFLLFFI